VSGDPASTVVSLSVICKLRPEAEVVDEVVEEPPDDFEDVAVEDVDDVLGLLDVLDCEVSVTKAIVATARTMTTATTTTVIPIALRLGFKQTHPLLRRFVINSFVRTGS